MKFPNIYATPHYKYYLLISLAIGILAVLTLPGLKYGIDLQGGTQLIATLTHTVSPNTLSSHLEKYSLEDLSVRFTENPISGRKGVIIEFAGTTDLIRAEKLLNTNPNEAVALAKPFISGDIPNTLTPSEVIDRAKADFTNKVQMDLVGFLGVGKDDISSVEIGASLGKEFWETSQRALLVAFFLIAAIVFILFREPVPSIAVIQAAFYDVLIALAGMSIFNIPITLPTIAGLLMILGHSVDTDILTTDRVLKRSEGTSADRAYSSMLTGVTITSTVLAVLLVLVIFSYFNQMGTLFQISAVLFFGLVGDLPSSYFTNTVLIKWWADRKK